MSRCNTLSACWFKLPREVGSFLGGLGSFILFLSFWFKRCNHIVIYIKSHMQFSWALLFLDRDGSQKGMFFTVVLKLGQWLFWVFWVHTRCVPICIWLVTHSPCSWWWPSVLFCFFFKKNKKQNSGETMICSYDDCRYEMLCCISPCVWHTREMMKNVRLI